MTGAGEGRGEGGEAEGAAAAAAAASSLLSASKWRPWDEDEVWGATSPRARRLAALRRDKARRGLRDPSLRLSVATGEAEARVARLETAVVTVGGVERRGEGGGEELWTHGGSGGPPMEVALVATVHVADAEYYRHLVEDVLPRYDRVLFELITDEENLEVDEEGRRRLAAGVPHLAPESLAVMAGVHGLSCQLDHVDHARPNWYHADLDRGKMQQMQRDASEEVFGEEDASRWGKGFKGLRVPKEVGEVLGAIARGPVKHRQTPLRGLLRSALWALVPTPEVFLLVLDWTWSNPGAPRPSRALPPLVDALARMDLRTARKLAFAQTLTNARELEKGADAVERGEASGDRSVLIGERNNQVVAALRQAERDGVANVAVLYGGLHMPDLEAKLGSELGLARLAGEPRWLTAWEIPLGSNGTDDGPPTVAALLGAPLYLVASGLDWYLCLSAWGDIATDSALQAAGVLAAVYGSYVLRRGVLYYSLAKWLFDWERGLFGDSGGASTS